MQRGAFLFIVIVFFCAVFCTQAAAKNLHFSTEAAPVYSFVSTKSKTPIPSICAHALLGATKTLATALGKLLITPVIFPFEGAISFVRSVFNLKPRGIFSTPQKLLVRLAFFLPGTVIGGEIADHLMISVVEYHKTTDSVFLPQSSETPMIMVNAFSPDTSLLDYFRYHLVQKLSVSLREKYPHLKYIEPTDALDFAQKLNAAGEEGKPFERMDFYGHGDQNGEIVKDGRLLLNETFQKEFRGETFAEGAVFRFNSCQTGNELVNSHGVCEPIAVTHTRVLAAGKSATAIGAKRIVGPSGFTEVLEYVAQTPFHAETAAIFSRPFALSTAITTQIAENMVGRRGLEWSNEPLVIISPLAPTTPVP